MDRFTQYVQVIESGADRAATHAEVTADPDLTPVQKAALYARIGIYQSDAERLRAAQATQEAADELRSA